MILTTMLHGIRFGTSTSVEKMYTGDHLSGIQTVRSHPLEIMGDMPESVRLFRLILLDLHNAGVIDTNFASELSMVNAIFWNLKTYHPSIRPCQVGAVESGHTRTHTHNAMVVGRF